MKTIGQIRRARLQQLSAAGLSYAELNSLLGRNRRDATLSQISKSAPNTTTGKPREMGGTQARQIEQVLKIDTGWFDTDPDQDVADFQLKLPNGQVLVIEAKAPKQASVYAVFDREAEYKLQWPFKTVRAADIVKLPDPSRDTLERLIHAYLGNPTSAPDWRKVAYRVAAELDHGKRSDRFTTFVRAIEVELDREAAAAAQVPA